MITKHPKRRKLSRKKAFVIYGRFDRSAGVGTIEIWKGDARSMASAFRKAISVLWKRPAIRWGHFQHVNFSGMAATHANKEARTHE